MDEQKKEEVVSETPAQSSSQQSAKEDLKKVADRAKAATSGFDFNKLFVGRVDAMNYLYSIIIAVVVCSIASYIPLVNIVVGLGLLVLGVGMSIRRLHDINMTGWATVGLFIPLLGFPLGIIYLCWKQGDVGSNQYGVVPEPKRDVFKAMLNA